jgi:uncharacterized repeat protein (TIGR03803 family)
MFNSICSVETDPNSLVLSNGILYGTTRSGGPLETGTLFSYELSSSTFNTLVVFDDDTNIGKYPKSLIIFNGVLYGATEGGGPSNWGTLFSYELSSSTFNTLVVFDNDTNIGKYPKSSLIIFNGVLYGATEGGGPLNRGTLFSYELSSSTFNTLVVFNNTNIGSSPESSLIIFNGILYGTTETGGSLNRGTLFSYELSSSTFNTLVVFDDTNIGENPNSLGFSGGVLYGATIYGGSSNHGTLFSYELSTTTFTTLVMFDDTNIGDGPNSLVFSDGILYGVTDVGGPLNRGTLFSYELSSSTFNTLVVFNDTNIGASPNSLILSNGILYGTTESGGDLDSGTIFKYSFNVSVACFKEDTRILTKEGYKPIQTLKRGDLVKTLLHDFLPIHMIGKQIIIHEACSERIKDQLYSGPDDIVLTGCHSILVDSYATKDQCDRSKDVNKGIFLTDKKYRLPACVDERFEVYNVPGTYTVYHLALENDNMFTNYGIYANGLLVETCSKNYLENRSNMIKIHK